MKNKRTFILGLSIVISLILAGSIFSIFVGQKSSVYEPSVTQETSQSLYAENSNEQEESSTDKVLVASNWVKHSGKGFFKFSIKTPPEANVCISDTAKAGDGGCFPEGVWFGEENYPFGISFEQTVLIGHDFDSIVKNLGYDGYVESNVDFNGADRQVMVSGSDTKFYWEEVNGKPVNVSKDVNFARYLVISGDYIYMPTIYTDTSNTDIELYQQILSTWEFLN